MTTERHCIGTKKLAGKRSEDRIDGPRLLYPLADPVSSPVWAEKSVLSERVEVLKGEERKGEHKQIMVPVQGERATP